MKIEEGLQKLRNEGSFWKLKKKEIKEKKSLKMNTTISVLWFY